MMNPFIPLLLRPSVAFADCSAISEGDLNSEGSKRKRPLVRGTPDSIWSAVARHRFGLMAAYPLFGVRRFVVALVVGIPGTTCRSPEFSAQIQSGDESPHSKNPKRRFSPYSKNPKRCRATALHMTTDLAFCM